MIMFVNGCIIVCEDSVGTSTSIVVTFYFRKDKQVRSLSRYKISNEILYAVTYLTAIYELCIIVHALFIL